MFQSNSHRTQAGGITILVSLMLLVFITIVAIGMSRNSFREVVISGTSRQGSMVRNIADSGIEWSIFWMTIDNQAGATAGTQSTLVQLKEALLLDSTKSGQPFNASSGEPVAYDTRNPPAPPTDLSWTTTSGLEEGHSLALTRMGKLPVANMSQGNGPGAFAPAQGNESKLAPDLWAIRSDAQLKVGTGLFASTFLHSKEAWISTPVQ